MRPSLAEARGSGTKRRYSYRDLLELKVIKRLLDAGVSLQSARRAVGCLREDLGADIASANLVLSDTTTVLAHSDGELVDLLAGGQGVFNIVPCRGWSTSWRRTSSGSSGRHQAAEDPRATLAARAAGE